MVGISRAIWGCNSVTNLNEGAAIMAMGPDGGQSPRRRPCPPQTRCQDMRQAFAGAPARRGARRDTPWPTAIMGPRKVQRSPPAPPANDHTAYGHGLHGRSRLASAKAVTHIRPWPHGALARMARYSGKRFDSCTRRPWVPPSSQTKPGRVAGLNGTEILKAQRQVPARMLETSAEGVQRCVGSAWSRAAFCTRRKAKPMFINT